MDKLVEREGRERERERERRETSFSFKKGSMYLRTHLTKQSNWEFHAFTHNNPAMFVAPAVTTHQ